MVIRSIFIAASRASAGLIAPLVEDARSLGYLVYLDRSVPGGSAWWRETIGALARADAFVYAVSRSSLDSDQCRIELEHASALRKPILPVLVEDGVSDVELPSSLGKIQRVDYRTANENAMAELFGALDGFTVAAPPEPSPPMPDPPRDFQTDLRDALAHTDYLGPAAQSEVSSQVRLCIEEGYSLSELMPIIEQFRARTELTLRLSRQLDEMQRELTERAPYVANWPEPGEEPDGVNEGNADVRSVFLSYSRSQQSAVTSLVGDLRRLGFTVWYDQNLPGGQQWWEQVLHQIRDSEAFVFAADAAALRSRACLLELDYAVALRKPAARFDLQTNLHLGSVSDSFADVAVCSYSPGDKLSIAQIARTLRRLSKVSLPDELPPPPMVPATYIFDVGTQIRSRRDLRPEEQQAVISQLDQYVEEGVPPADLRRFLTEFSRRDDITVDISHKVLALGQKLGLDADALAFGERRGPVSSLIAHPAASAIPSAAAEHAPVEFDPLEPMHVEPGRVSRDKQAFDFLSAEYPEVFDAVWDCAVRLEKWPRFPTPAFRQACALVARGQTADHAVSKSFH